MRLLTLLAEGAAELRHLIRAILFHTHLHCVEACELTDFKALPYIGKSVANSDSRHSGRAAAAGAQDEPGEYAAQGERVQHRAAAGDVRRWGRN